MTARPVPEGALDFLQELVANGLLVPSGVKGLFGRGAMFETIIRRFDQLVSRAGAPDNAEYFHFPPLVTRKHFEQSEYMKAFPDMVGVVHSFMGGDREHGELLASIDSGGDWGAMLKQTDVVLTPAACYPLYPMVSGTLPQGGRSFEVFSYCFRHEPSDDPPRMLAFRQREFVQVGDVEAAHAFRDRWQPRAIALLESVGLPVKLVPANDPFFGRRGRMLVADQLENSLKFELVVPITSTERPTACVSLNYHQDHFGHLFGIHTADGARAHTACIGFGMERTALALLKTHGMNVESWPASVRKVLEL